MVEYVGILHRQSEIQVTFQRTLRAVELLRGFGSEDKRLTQVLRLQAETNQEMVRLNREVAQGISQLTKENAEFRTEALALQKELNTQRAEIKTLNERKPEAVTPVVKAPPLGGSEHEE